jgi:hypothetical protein
VVWLQNTAPAEIITLSRKDEKDEFLILINLSSRIVTGSVEISGAEDFTLLKIDGLPALPKSTLPEFQLGGYEWRIYQRTVTK